MAKTGEIRYDGTNFLLTMITTDVEEAHDLATAMGKAGLTDVWTSEVPMQFSAGNNSGSRMRQLVDMEIFNYIINNP